jgi:hypothetical protein
MLISNPDSKTGESSLPATATASPDSTALIAIAGLTVLNEQHSERRLTFKRLKKLRVSE